MALCGSITRSGLTAYDWTGNGNAGTFNNAVASNVWVNSVGQTAFQFTGASSNYVKVPYSISLNNTNVFSEVVWFLSTVASGCLTSWNGAATTKYQLSIGASMPSSGGTSAKLSAQIYSSGGTHLTTITSAASVNDSNWHCGIITMSGSTLSLYLDGLQVATSATQGGSITTDTNDALTLGVNSASGIPMSANLNYFTGFMDDVRIYNRVLTTDEIWTLSQARAIAFTPSYAGGYSPQGIKTILRSQILRSSILKRSIT